MKEDGQKSVTDCVADFTEDTTFHGLGRIKIRENKFRSAVWLILFMIFLGYFLSILGMAVQRYQKRDITTKVTVEESDSLQFPTVTFCYYNAVSKKFAKRDSFTENVVLAGSNLTLHLSKLNVSDPKTIKAVEAINMYEFYKDATPKKEDIFADCSWKGRTFSKCWEQFEEVLTPWGFCFSFNGPQTLQQEGQYRNVTRIGSRHGLWLQMNVQQSDYYQQRQGYAAAGYKMLLHSPEVVPRVNELGFAISPGTETMVGILEKRVKKLPPPYLGSKCIDMESSDFQNPLKFYPIYSEESCRTECETNFINKSCGCTPYYLRAESYKNCSVSDFYSCVMVAEGEYGQNDLHEQSCDCPDACNNTYYSASLSSADYPSQLVSETYGSALNITEEYIRNNVLVVHIYHEDLSYQYIEQLEAYSSTDLQADIGGNLGLCIGGSLISCLELMELLMVLCCNGCSRKNIKGKNSVGDTKQQWVTPSHKSPL